MFGLVIKYLSEIQLFKNQEYEGANKNNQKIENVAFKVVQMKFVATHITNKKTL